MRPKRALERDLNQNKFECSFVVDETEEVCESKQAKERIW